jgi:hypothetical protein
MDIINENSSAIAEVAFFNENGSAITPTSASYQLITKFTGTTRKSASIGSLAETVSIELTSVDNIIEDANNRYEIVTLIVTFQYDGKIGITTLDYKIVNLPGLAGGSSSSSSRSSSSSSSSSLSSSSSSSSFSISLSITP